MLGLRSQGQREELAESTTAFTRAKSVRELAKGADALVLVTEWPEFREHPVQALSPR